MERGQWGTELDLDANPDAPIRVVHTEDKEAESPFALLLNGEIVPAKEVSIWEYTSDWHWDVGDESERVPLEMWVGNSERARQLLSFSSREILPRAVVQAEMPRSPDWTLEAMTLIFRVHRRPRLRLDFTLRFDTLNWKGFWSIAQYAEEFERTLIASASSGLQVSSSLSPDAQDQQLVITPTTVPDDVALAVPLAEWEAALVQVHDAVVHKLIEDLPSESVIAHFQFQPEVRTACEQYLLYFIQLRCSCQTSYADRNGQYWVQTGVTLPCSWCWCSSALRDRRSQAACSHRPQPYDQGRPHHLCALEGSQPTPVSCGVRRITSGRNSVIYAPNYVGR